MASPPKLIRHRIKEIELQPNTHNYPISIKVFVDDGEVCELPPIKRHQALKWTRPIICRDVTLQSKVSLEITEVHTIRDKPYKSETYEISKIQSQTETTLVFPRTRWTAKITLLVPETADQSYSKARQQLKEIKLASSALDKLGRAQDVLEAILDFGNAVADAHPAAKMVFSVCTVVWDYDPVVQKLKEEQKLGEDTQDLIDGLCRDGGIVDLAKVAKGHTRLEQLKNTIDEILLLLEDVFVYILERNSKGGFQAIRRLFDSEDRDIVDGLLGKLEALRKDFDSGVAVDIQMVVYSIDSKLLRDSLNPVDQSSFNLDNRECQDGTRRDLLTNILAWVHASPNTTSDSNTVLWIYGQAGIGKSAIAASLYKQLFHDGKLAASFFCKYDDPRLQHPMEVINTIAHGLALSNQAYRDALVAAIKANQSTCTTPSMQLRYEGLLKKPLTPLHDISGPQPLIVLVDALDECGTTDARGNLIECLWDLSQIVPWLKVIVTSRPDADIKAQIEKLNHNSTSRRDVHDFEASDDIHAYLKQGLSGLASSHGWPEGSIEQLRDKASGLFIWASTAKRFITGAIGSRSTKSRLEIVLADQGSGYSEPLDVLYVRVVRNGIGEGQPDNEETFRRCVGAIVAVSTRRPLSLPDLCSLLKGEIDAGEMWAVVDRLGSVLHTDEKMGGAIRFYHQSFVDFVRDRLRSNDLCIDLARRNAELAKRCLATMQAELRFNICGLETSCCFNTGVHGMDDRINQAISVPLRYSCIYWISHLVSEDTAEHVSLASEVQTALKGQRALYWIEVLSLLGRMDVAATGLLELLERLTDDSEGTRKWIIDLYRFTLAFYDAISASTPHLYLSALALAPGSAEVCQLKALFPNTLSVTGGDERWPNWLRTLNHPTGVYSCAISRDGQHLATGCDDGIIRLWNMRTGAQVGDPIVGHSEAVTSVAFSPDSSLVVSGSYDNTVRIWDVKTRAQVGDPIVGHSEAVTSVAFSPDGSPVVSGSSDNTVRIWDVKTRAQVGDPIVGHSHPVTSVAFSPDGSLVVSGSSDKTVRIWDVKTRAQVGDPIVGHSHAVSSVAFSPDSSRLASGSLDNTVRMLNTRASRLKLDFALHTHSFPAFGPSPNPSHTITILVVYKHVLPASTFGS